MTKLFVTLPALALVVALSGSAVADNGISQATLQDMGLAGIQVMSDSDAMAIRGLGYQGGGHHMPKPSKNEKPWSLAFGLSYASIEDGWKSEGSAGTVDGFIAEGKYMVAGEHYSEAGRTTIDSHELQVKGEPATLDIKIKTVKVFAGGFANATSL